MRCCGIDERLTSWSNWQLALYGAQRATPPAPENLELFFAAAEQEALRVFSQIRHGLVDIDYSAVGVAPDDVDLLGRSLRHFVDAGW